MFARAWSAVQQVRQVPCSGGRWPGDGPACRREGSSCESRRLGSENSWSAGRKVVAHLTQLRCAHQVRVEGVPMTKLAGHLAGAWLPGADFGMLRGGSSLEEWWQSGGRVVADLWQSGGVADLWQSAQQTDQR